MLLKPASQLKFSDVEDLIRNQTPESRHIEYKEQLPNLAANEERKEFLADISAFANASGGHIVYGVSEALENGKNTGLPKEIVSLKIENIEQEVIRLSQCIRQSIEPTLHGVQIEVCEEADSLAQKVLIISIPQSWSPPHMVSVKGSTKFFSRSDRGKSQMDFTEIKRAFSGSDIIEEKLRNFRSERLGKILACDSGFDLRGGPSWAIHIIPVSNFLELKQLDISELRSKMDGLYPPSHNGWSHRVNLDGRALFAKYKDTQKVSSYVQVFRSGVVEAVDCYALNTSDGEKFFASPHVEQEIVDFYNASIKFYSKVEINGPAVVALSFLNMRGFQIGSNKPWPMRHMDKVDRDHIILPEQIVESFGVKGEKILRPSFDLLCNALGLDGCRYYDEKGEWNVQIS